MLNLFSILDCDRILLEEGVFMGITNEKINVKCTRCGAKATIGGNGEFYTCPACTRQVHTASAKVMFEKSQISKDTSAQPGGASRPDEGAQTRPHIDSATDAVVKEAHRTKVHVKCTYCGAKAVVSDEYYLYTCPVCHRQVNTASAKSTYENQQTLKDISPEKAKVSYQSPKPVSAQTTAVKSDSSKSDDGGWIFGLLLLIFLLVCIIIICIAYPIIGALVGFGIICGIVHYMNEKNGTNEKRRQKEFEQIGKEYEEAVESQKSGAPWAKRYSTHPCPHCGHYKVREATWDDKRYSVAFWGAASSKIGTRYKCDHCGNMWS